jgi:DNA-directed RNA polymerase subunit H (RpoH/RPB5)
MSSSPSPSSPSSILREILVEQRGWRALNDDIFLDRDGRRRRVHVFEGSVNVEAVRHALSEASRDAGEGPPIIVGDTITTVFNGMEFIPRDMLLMNPFKHEMVPIYAVYSGTESHDVAGSAFPKGAVPEGTALKMSASDPIAVLMGLRPGDAVLARPKPSMSKCTPRETVRIIT